MAMHADGHVVGHTPFRKGGWGFALVISALAVGCWVMAWMVHQRTYLHPTDPRWHAIEPQHHAPAEGTPGAATDHGEQAGEVGAPPATRPTSDH